MSKLSEKLDLRKDFPGSSFEEWKKVAEKDLKGLPYDKSLITKTYEGIDLQPIYTQEDIQNNPLLENFPGIPVFVRGSKPEGSVSGSWLISQELPYYNPVDYNEALKYDLERGLNSVYFRLDLASLLSKNPDKAHADEIGKGGTSVAAMEDLDKCFKDVDLSGLPLIVNGGYSSLPAFAMFMAYFRKKGIDVSKLKGAFLSDPFVFAMRSGITPFDINTAFDEIFKITEWNIENKTNLKTIGVCGYEYCNAGANAVQELAYAMSSAIEYINQMLDKGLTIDNIAPRFFFTFGISTNYFMEIAKLRAARILWSNIIDAYKGSDESKKIFIHSKSSYYNQAKNDIYVNLLRTTTEAFSAIVGGADSIYTSPFDETIGLPDEFSRRLARNAQIILSEESHLNAVIDPAGGSYYIETLTEELAKKSWELVKSLDSSGGMLNAVINTLTQSEIGKVAAAKEKDYAKRKKVIVGNNMYANIKEEKFPEKDNDLPSFVKSRIDDFGKRKKIKVTLDKNLVNSMIEAFSNGAAIGDVAQALNRKPADKQITPLKIKRASEIFEELRNMSYDYKDKKGYLPKVFFAAMGPLKQHKARADFSRGFFEVGGFDVIYKTGFNSVDEAVKSALESKSEIVVICSTDDTYPEIVPALTKKLKSGIKNVKVILAGYPKDMVETYSKNGIDDFIYLGADVYELNKKLLTGLN